MTRIGRRGLLGAIALIGLGAAPPPAEPDTYRMRDYKGPTPLTLDGTPALSTEQAAQLWRSGTAIFVDTLARAPKPAGLPPGTIWHPEPREDIPGSIWLADTGYGALPNVMESYFTNALREATGGDRNKPLVFYCRAECWMSWNAARRASALGYSDVRWYRDGTDGWAAAHLPLEPREPLPRPSQADVSPAKAG